MKISKYRQHHSEPEGDIFLRALRFHDIRYQWSHYLGIPLCGEADRLNDVFQSLSGLHSAFDGQRFFCTLVINEHLDSPDYHRQSNQQTLERLREYPGVQCLVAKPNMYWLPGDTYDMLVIDRTGEAAFPQKQGVGLARKILGDIGHILWDEGLLHSRWLHQTDADATLPADYFHQAFAFEKSPQIKALLYQYRHIPLTHDSTSRQDHWQAAQLYETWLRYYEEGLNWAGSPYAFPTVGSLVTVDAEAYRQVRGFPRRNAAEDFYLLNKIAKTGAIQVLTGDPIELLDRDSDRVPFGTGQGTRKIAGLQRDGGEFHIYDPRVFGVLKLVLTWARAACQNMVDPNQLKHELSQLDGISQLDHTEFSVESLARDMIEFGFLAAIERAKNQTQMDHQALQQFHIWFDSFRTLKWVHLLRDRYFGTLPVLDALQRSVFLNHGSEKGIDQSLAALRNSQKRSRCLGLTFP